MRTSSRTCSGQTASRRQIADGVNHGSMARRREGEISMTKLRRWLLGSPWRKASNPSSRRQSSAVSRRRMAQKKPWRTRERQGIT
eukprot:1754585-Pleurochrysis_carterae.AAC.1